MGKITLVIGGTKSGKTSFAQERASALSSSTGTNVVYIATALALDDGMKKRIAKHRQSRPVGWITAEEPLKVSGILKKVSENMCAVIIDCLTMLTTNIILELGEAPAREEAQHLVLTEINNIISEAGKIDAELIIISNQVEVGLVAPTRLGGIFQDIAGLSHQVLADSADEVVLMTAGIPLKLKG